MGLIRAAKEAVSSMLADQWREYFYCDALSNDVLMTKGKKRITSSRNSNTKGSDNIISNGSVVAVNEGQCMIIVEQGEIVDVCAEPGEFVYDNSTEPSLFYGDLEENVKNSFSATAKRFAFGGSSPKDQRVYFFNTKEILGNMYGTANPIPFHLVDRNSGFSFETSVKCNGIFTFRLVDPILFYKNVCANVRDSYEKSELVSVMKNELVLALQPVLATIGGQGVLPSQLIGHTKDITELASKELTTQWTQKRGIRMLSLTISPTFPKEDVDRINKWAETAVLQNSRMQEARKTEAFANMMEGGKGGAGGDAMSGAISMMAMGMMNQMMGGGNAFGGVTGGQNAGAQNATVNGWTCSCGALNQGKFCSNCGNRKPQGAPLYRCDKCGWQPENPANPPKFCPECGDRFDEGDRI